MKLFEFSVLIERNVVVLAEDETKAIEGLDSMSIDGLSSCGDPHDVVDVQLVDVRQGGKDEAHVEA